MQCVILSVSCLVALASAGVLGHPLHYSAHHGSATSYASVHHGAGHSVPYSVPFSHGYAHAGQGYDHPAVDPVAIKAGAPLPVGDTYEVAAAKAKHFQAHAEARGRIYGASLGHYSHGYVGHGFDRSLVDPVAIAAGAPLPVGDTHEVAAAKAKHFQAHAEARGRIHAAPVAHGFAYAAPYAHGYAAPAIHGYAHGSLVDPVAIAAGAPLPVGDTYEVAAAKAAHLQAHAAARHGHLYG